MRLRVVAAVAIAAVGVAGGARGVRLVGAEAIPQRTCQETVPEAGPACITVAHDESRVTVLAEAGYYGAAGLQLVSAAEGTDATAVVYVFPTLAGVWVGTRGTTAFVFVFVIALVAGPFVYVAGGMNDDVVGVFAGSCLAILNSCLTLVGAGAAASTAGEAVLAAETVGATATGGASPDGASADARACATTVFSCIPVVRAGATAAPGGATVMVCPSNSPCTDQSVPLPPAPSAARDWGPS